MTTDLSTVVRLRSSIARKVRALVRDLQPALEVHRRTWGASTALLVMCVVGGVVLISLVTPLVKAMLPVDVNDFYTTGWRGLLTQLTLTVPFFAVGLVITIFWSVGVSRLVQVSQAGHRPRVADGLAAAVRRFVPASLTLGTATLLLILVTVLYPVVAVVALAGLVATPLVRLASRFRGRDVRWPRWRSLVLMLVPLGPAVVLSSRWALILPAITRAGVQPRQAFAFSVEQSRGRRLRIVGLMFVASLIVFCSGFIVAFPLGLINDSDGVIAAGRVLGQVFIAALPLVMLTLLGGADGTNPADHVPEPLSPPSRRNRAVAQAVVFAMLLQLVLPGFVNVPDALAQGATPVVITMVEPVGQTLTGDVVFAFTVEPTTALGFGPSGELSLSVNEAPQGSVFQNPPGGVPDANWRGRWEFTVPLPDAGNFEVVATYFGDSFYDLDQLFARVDVVGAPATTTSLTSAPSPSFFGEEVTLQASVTADGVTPTGSVEFESSIDGLLSTVPLDLTGAASLAVATLTTDSAHTITATYAAQDGFRESQGSAIHNVSSVATTVAVATNLASPTASGTPLVVKVAVAPDIGTAVPEGSVVIRTTSTVDGSTSITALPSIDLLNGEASATFNSLGVGNHIFEASYTPDPGFLASAASTPPHLVERAVSTTSLTVAPTSVFGESVLMSASINVGSDVPTPTGMVEFFEGTSSLGTTNLNGVGTTSLTTEILPLTTGSLSAVYSGDSNVVASSSPAVPHVVGRSAVQVTISDDGAQVRPGSDATVTVTVLAEAPGSGLATGTVTLTSRGTSIGDAPVLDGAGQTSVQVPMPTAGTYDLMASYSGDANFLPGSADSTLIAVTAQTQTFLQQSASSSIFGDTITFRTQVISLSDGGSVPVGDVQLRGPNGVLQTVTLDAQGEAEFLVSDLDHRPSINGSSGLSFLNAVFVGSPRYMTSRSASVSHDVGQATPSISLTWSPNPVSTTTLTTLTASVTGVGAVAPTGQVEFRSFPDNRLLGFGVLADGVATLAVQLDSDTNAVFTGYPGATNYRSVELVTPLTISTGSLAPTVSIEPSPADYGQVATVRATLPTVAGFVPTGTVQFIDGSRTIATMPLVNGTAEVQACAGGGCSGGLYELALGTNQIQALYSGDERFGRGSSQVLDHLVRPARTSIEILNQGSASINVGDGYQVIVRVNSDNSPLTPRGWVEFVAVNATGGLIVLQTVPVTDPGTANLSATAGSPAGLVPGGTVSIRVRYLPPTGRATFASSTISIPLDVRRGTVPMQFVEMLPLPQVGVESQVRVRVGDAGTAGRDFTGRVYFTTSAGETCNSRVDEFNEASCYVTWSKAGIGSYVATYSGDQITAESNTGHQQIEVRKGEAIITATARPSSGDWATGDPITIAYYIAGPSDGDVRVYDSATGINHCEGLTFFAFCDVAYQTGGSKSIVLSYDGNDDWEVSTQQFDGNVLLCLLKPFRATPPDAGVVLATTRGNCNGGDGYRYGTEITVTARPNTGSFFQQWGWGNDATGLNDDATTEFIVGVDALAAEAIFSSPCVKLTIGENADRTPGSVGVFPDPNCRSAEGADGLQVGSNGRFVSGWYTPGTDVTLRARGVGGSTLIGLGGVPDWPGEQVYTFAINESVTASPRFGSCTHFRLADDVTTSTEPTCLGDQGPGYTVGTTVVFATELGLQEVVAGWALNETESFDVTEPVFEYTITPDTRPNVSASAISVRVERVQCSQVALQISNPGGWPVTASLSADDTCNSLGDNYRSGETWVSTDATGENPEWLDGTRVNWTTSSATVLPNNRGRQGFTLDYNGDAAASFRPAFPQEVITIELTNNDWCNDVEVAFVDADPAQSGDYSWSQATPRAMKCPEGRLDGRFPVQIVGTPTSDQANLAFTHSNVDFVQLINTSAAADINGTLRTAELPALGPLLSTGEIIVTHCQALNLTAKVIRDDLSEVALDTASASAFVEITSDDGPCPGEWPRNESIYPLGSEVTLRPLTDPASLPVTSWVVGDASVPDGDQRISVDGPEASVDVTGVINVKCHTLHARAYHIEDDRWYDTALTDSSQRQAMQADRALYESLRDRDLFRAGDPLDETERGQLALYGGSFFGGPSVAGQQIEINSTATCIGPNGPNRFLGGSEIGVALSRCPSGRHWQEWWWVSDDGATAEMVVLDGADDRGIVPRDGLINPGRITKTTAFEFQIFSDVGLEPNCRDTPWQDEAVEFFEDMGDALAVFGKKALGVVTMVGTNLVTNWPPVGTAIQLVSLSMLGIGELIKLVPGGDDAAEIFLAGHQTIQIFGNTANCVGEWALSDSTPPPPPPEFSPSNRATRPVNAFSNSDLQTQIAANGGRLYIEIELPDGTTISDPLVIAQLASDLNAQLIADIEAQGNTVSAEWGPVIEAVRADLEATEAQPQAGVQSADLKVFEDVMIGFTVLNAFRKAADTVVLLRSGIIIKPVFASAPYGTPTEALKALIKAKIAGLLPTAGATPLEIISLADGEIQDLSAVDDFVDDLVSTFDSADDVADDLPELQELYQKFGEADNVDDFDDFLSNYADDYVDEAVNQADDLVVAGSNSLDDLAAAGANSLDDAAAAGANSLDDVAAAGANSLDDVAAAGANSLDDVAAAGANSLDDVAAAGANSLDDVASVAGAGGSTAKAIAGKAIGPAIVVGTTFYTMGSAGTLGWESTAEDAWSTSNGQLAACVKNAMPDYLTDALEDEYG